MKKLFWFIGIISLLSVLFISCSRVSADINEEVVFDKHPVFGKGGIDMNPLQEGSCIKSPFTKTYKFVMTPTRYEENFTNIYTLDRTSVSLNAFLTLRLIKGKTPVLLRNFGVDWYENSLQEPFREMIRNKLCTYSMIELVSGRNIHEEGKDEIQKKIEDYIKTLDMPVEVVTLVISKVEPPEEVQKELNTLAQEKAKEKTQEQRIKTEKAKWEANKAQADAEKILYTGMGFTPAQYIDYLRAMALQNRSDILRIENIK